MWLLCSWSAPLFSICKKQVFLWCSSWLTTPSDSKFKDGHAFANSADPDETAPREAVLSGFALFAIQLHISDKFLYGKTFLFEF